MAPSGHAVSGGGRLLPCMFSCMPTVPVRALGFRVCTCAWDGGTAPRRYGLRLGMTRLEYNNPLLTLTYRARDEPIQSWGVLGCGMRGEEQASGPEARERQHAACGQRGA